MEIAGVTDALAALRIAVFRDFPYLYDGNMTYEREYLQTYINSKSSLLFSVFDGNKMVGATTCILLSHETPDVQEPFLQKKIDLQKIFYFGESILLQEYRGLGLGHRFFEERERHSRSHTGVDTACFCAVKRNTHHPLRPLNYQPLDEFWIRRGYTKDADLVSIFEWKDRNEVEPSHKTMEYWFKKL